MWIFAADLHLKSYTWPRYPEIKDDAFHVTSWIIDYAAEHQAEALVLGGDVFDPPTSSAIDWLQRKLDRFPGEIYGICGQHDRAAPNWLGVHNLRGRDLHHTVRTIGGRTVAGLNYTPRTRLEEALTGMPEADILVLHQLISSLLDIPGAYTLMEAWVPRSCKLLLMGDWHRPEEFVLGPGRRAFYGGSIVPQRRNELGYAHRILAVTDTTVDSVPLPGRRIERVVASSLEELTSLEAADTVFEALAADVRFAGMTPVLWVDYLASGEVGLPEVLQAIRAKASKLDLLLVAVPRTMEVDVDEPVCASAVPLDLSAALAELVEDGETRKVLQEVLAASSPSVFPSLRSTFGVEHLIH